MKIIRNINISLWEWVKAICTLMLVGVLSYKIYITPFNVTVDFPTLLSLLLALFSVALAALFYFKATDTSNTFYDNTYNFTKEISSLLVKIESGFGERLKHLDEGYASMRDNLPNYSDQKTDDTKEKIKDEKHEIEKVSSERNEIIKNLLEKSQLQAAEKDRISRDLKNKEDELVHAQKELSKMNQRLVIERIRKSRTGTKSGENGIRSFTKDAVINKIGVEKILSASSNSVKRSFNQIAGTLPKNYIKDLESQGYFDEGLTDEGLSFLHDIIL